MLQQIKINGINDYEVRSALDDIARADAHMKNPKMMAAIDKYLSNCQSVVKTNKLGKTMSDCKKQSRGC